jgi:toxin ParE1/3/4
MAYRVIWSSKSIEDVEAIAIYIARDSSAYAAAVVHKILETTRQLRHDPRGNTLAESRDHELKERRAYSYRIIYCVAEDKVTILTIVHAKCHAKFHGKRQLESSS